MGLPFRPETRFGWVSLAAAIVSWTYAVAVAIGLTRLPADSVQLIRLAEWAALPVQLLALVLVAYLLCSGRRELGAPRATWWCVLVFTAGGPVAAAVWNSVRPVITREYLTFSDGVYLLDYWALTIAFALLFVDAGGSFRRARIWLDATTMTAVQLVGLWAFFLVPFAASGRGRGITLSAMIAYSLTLTGMMTMAALLCVQLPTFRGRMSVLLLVAAGLAEVTWEIMWLSSWVTDRDFVGIFYNLGDVLCFAAVTSAVAATQCRAPALCEVSTPEERADGFLPALSVLLAIGLVAGSLATTRRADAWILVGLVALCALLLITRQQSVRKELRDLRRQLGKREADARLTELVRRSADLIMVIDADGIVDFASPASERMLGVSVAAIHGRRVVELFGLENCQVLEKFLECTRVQPTATSVVELRIERTAQAVRVIKLSAINQLENELINGIVLTFSDITEQRMLEREVLDVVARERVRLSADIHDGLGQELAGISMLLHGSATTPNPDAATQKAHLQAIVGHVNRTIVTARNLARGLSPLHVVRGSLSSALSSLIPESHQSIALHLDVDAAFDQRVIEDSYADHLYRIAQEAVSNALRHSGCSRIDIVLQRTGDGIMLAVADDGRGFNEPTADYPGLGLRLMEYRARIVGGTLRFDSAPGAGARVQIMLPIRMT